MNAREAIPISVDSLAAVEPRGAVLCIGNFDGVHLGHRTLLRRMHDLASDLAAPAVVVTFFPPARVLFEGATFLMTPEEKLLALGEFHPDVVVNIAFDREFAATDKSSWLAELAELQPAAIIVGKDFRFGRGRQGGIADLGTVTDKLEVFPLVEKDGAPVKSSDIRRLLAEGDVKGAARLLGAPYLVRGVVVKGQRRGAGIGYPTANLSVPAGKAVPLGVFAVRVSVAGETFGGMANAGPRPSFEETPPALEVYLFDFDRNLYGAELDVRFVEHLRAQLKFAGLEELRAQLAADETAAREILATSA